MGRGDRDEMLIDGDGRRRWGCASERETTTASERAHVRFGHSRWLMVQLLINDGALQTRGPRVRDARPLLSEFLFALLSPLARSIVGRCPVALAAACS